MKMHIDRNEKIPLYMQIAKQIKECIFDGSLVDGYPLPSERGLAKELNVHRNTVVRAYSELKDEGLIVSYQGLGYRVSYRKLFYGMVKKPINWQALIKEEYLSFESDFDDLYSKTYETNLISFAGGVASTEVYPVEETAAVFEKVLLSSREKAYFYTPYQGDKELRKELVSFMATKGIITKAGEVQIFSENNQALDFLMTLMLFPGDKVLMQEMVSPDMYRTIQLAGGRVVTAPMDENGMICDNLDALLEKEKPKFIYVDSSFHNPTGVSMSVERRQKLLELSYKYRIPIIEEDEGSELYYDKENIPSIKSMDTGSNVIYMYSFSLTMMPGLGLAFVIADRDVISRLSKLISVRLITLDWTPQMLTLEYMKDGTFVERLGSFRKIYRQKRDLMCRCLDELKEEFGLEYEVPEGGVYLWVKLPKGMDSRRLLAEAQKMGVTFMPGYVFYLRKARGSSHLRLNYSYPTEQQIKEGMKKLAAAMRMVKQKIQIK